MTRVAEQAGLSQQMVSYVERGMRNPTLEVLLRITEALDLQVDNVLSRACGSFQGRLGKPKGRLLSKG